MKVLGVLLTICLSAHPGMAAERDTAAQKAQVQSTRESVKPAAQPLNDTDAEELAQREEKPGKEVKGGALSNEHLTYIVIALAAAVLVLIAVR